jgi:hypothetical protein
LLPPEIEQVRLIRAKKPWALAASALVLLGLTLLFTAGDYRVLAKVTTPQFKEAVTQAKRVSEQGSKQKSDFEKASGVWKAKYGEGEALIIDPSDRAMWPQFLKMVSNYFPDPVKDYGLDPNAAESQDVLDKLRVHIDAIKPVWRTDLKAEWFDKIDVTFKKLMHPLDAQNPPTGEGWVIQLVCHHYNPYPKTREQRELGPKDPRRTDFGPYQFITDKVLTKLNNPELRLFGVDHVAVAWLDKDTEWTSEKGVQNNNLASNTVPLLDRASPPASTDAAAGGPTGSSPGQMGGMMSMGSQRGMMGRGGGDSMAGGMMAGMRGMGDMRGMGMGMGTMGGYGGAAAGAPSKKDYKMLTRTDFLLQFVWVRVKPEAQPKTPEELKAKLEEIVKKLSEAEKTYTPDTATAKLEEAIEAESLKKSKALDSAIEKAIGGPNPAGAVAPPPGGGPNISAPPAGVGPKGSNPPSK